MSPLRNLIEAIEAGDIEADAWRDAWRHDKIMTVTQITLAKAAFRNHVDAANALRELLPADFIASSDSTGFAHVWQDEHEITRNWAALVPGNEGRARLLATLKAYEAIK